MNDEVYGIETKELQASPATIQPAVPGPGTMGTADSLAHLVSE